MCLSRFKYAFVVSILLALVDLSASAQADPDTTSEQLLKPRVEIGIGRLAYFGDIGRGFQSYNPLVGNIGAHFKFGAPLNHFLDFDAYALYGRLSMSETTGPRKLNFSSELRLMGASVSYNFGNLLKSDHSIAPYISVGIAGFEFLSKTDLFDNAGNRYHYWNDGTIRNLPENSANAGDAIEIQRNYEYETDIRKLDADGLGSYPERSWAIPVGAGATLNLSDHLKLRIGGEMYFTFTNHIDGITEESTGNRQGNSRNDWFFYTNAGISYNFEMHGEKTPKEKSYAGEDLVAMDFDDEDGDGVIDLIDECPGTPSGVQVNELGCPVDSDNDGVPDYRDEEPDTAPNAHVDADGVTIDDEYFLNSYLFWIDSVYDTNYLTSRTETASLPRGKKTKRPVKRSYHVQIKQNDAMSSEDIERLLSIPDVRAIEQDGETIYLIGTYSDLYKAVERKINLETDGIAGIVVVNESGRYLEIPDESASIEADLRRISDVDTEYDEELSSPTMDVVYRVQIGAFQNPLSQDIFSDVSQLIVIKGSDNLTRYVSGSFDNLQDAANRKVNLLLEGFEGAFITAYRGGKRISLTEAGAIVSGKDDKTQEVASPSFDVSRVKFRVQIAAYRDEVPTEMLDQFIELGEIKPMRGPDGATRYVFGEFDTYEKAVEAKENIANQKFKDAFVVGEFNGQLITAQEAIQILED